MRIEYAGTVLARPDYAHVGYVSAGNHPNTVGGMEFGLVLALFFGLLAIWVTCWKERSREGRGVRTFLMIVLWFLTALALYGAAVAGWRLHYLLSR